MSKFLQAPCTTDDRFFNFVTQQVAIVYPTSLISQRIDIL